MSIIIYNVGDNRYCVPAALASILAVPVSLACDLLAEELGDQPISGVHYPLLLKILKQKYNFLIEQNAQYRSTEGLWLLCFPGHVGVVRNYIYYDNQFPTGIAVSAAKRAVASYKLTKKENK